VSNGKKCGALLFSLNFLLVLFFVSGQRKEHASNQAITNSFNEKDKFRACPPRSTADRRNPFNCDE
jgi:hypothetical protein